MKHQRAVLRGQAGDQGEGFAGGDNAGREVGSHHRPVAIVLSRNAAPAKALKITGRMS
jgi:hypothetical protein